MSVFPFGLAVPDRLLVSLLVVSAVFCGARLARHAAALEPGATEAKVTQDGWWNRLQGPVEGEPDGNPVRPLLPALPAPPTVPPDSIVASAVGGETDKVAAVGIEVALPGEVFLDQLNLHLKESPGAGANVSSSEARVLACPATHPWGGHKNASWTDRPQADCDLGQVQGERAADGTWTFDLTPLGDLWTDPDTPLPQNGVVLSIDAAASPALTQVSWMDFDSGNVAVEALGAAASSEAYMMTVPADDISARASAPPLAPAAAGEMSRTGSRPLDGTADAVPAPAPPLASPSGESLLLPQDQGRLTSGDEAAAPVPSPDQVALTTAPSFPSPPQAVRARPRVGFWTDTPTSTALMIPVALGLALLVGFALGPSGRPQPVARRAGGLSRALARRNGGGDDAI